MQIIFPPRLLKIVFFIGLTLPYQILAAESGEKIKTQELFENVLTIFDSNNTINNQTDFKQLLKHHRLPKVERILRSKIAVTKYDPEVHFQLARVLSWQKKYPDALEEYDRLLKKHPGNSDYLLGKAQTLYWDKQDNAALEILETARLSSPEHLGVWKLQITILQNSTRQTDKDKAEILRTQAMLRFPASNWSSTTISAEEDISFTEVEFGTSADILDGSYDDWSSYYLSAEHQFQNRRKIYSVITQTERFKLVDKELLIGFFTPINSNWNFLIDTSIAPDNKVRPKWSTFVQLQRSFNDGWNAYLGLRKTKYDKTDTQAFSFTVERYWKNFRFDYTAFATRISGPAITTETLLTNALGGDYFYDDKSYIGAAVTSGKELEYNGTANPPRSEVDALVIRGRHWLNNHWAVSYSLLQHTQGTFYTRYGYRIGLRYRY